MKHRWWKTKYDRAKDEYDAQYKIMMEFITKDISKMTQQDIVRHTKELEINERNYNKARDRREYLGTSNKMNLVWWGYWWHSLSGNIFAMITQGYNGFYLSIAIMAGAMIVFWCSLAVKNDRKRTELFLERI